MESAEPWEGHAGSVRAFVIDPGRDRVISGGDDGTLRITDLSIAVSREICRAHTEGVTGLALTLDGRWLVSASRDGEIKSWDRSTGILAKQIQGSGKSILRLEILSDGKHLVSSGPSGSSIREVETGRLVAALEQGASLFSEAAVAALRDGRLALGGVGGDFDDGSLTILEPNRTRVVAERRQHINKVMSLAVAGDGRRLVSGGWDDWVVVWDLDTLEALCTFRPEVDGSLHTHGEPPSPVVAISHNGERVAAGFLDGSLWIWEPGKERELHRLKPHRSAVLGVKVLEDGRHVLSYGADAWLTIWDMETGVRRAAFPFDSVVQCLEISGSLIVAGTLMGRVQLLELHDLEPPRPAPALQPAAHAPRGRCF